MRPADSFLTDLRSAAFPGPTAFSRWNAELDLDFARTDARITEPRTALIRCRHLGPLRVQKALYPEGNEICHALILHPPGGVAGGDELAVHVGVGEAARAVLSTPGAAKWYKANGMPASQTIRLSLQPGAHLDWLPLENILFDGAQARMRLRIDCALGASAIGWDACVLGRSAAGELWGEGALHSETELRCDGKLRWVERFDLDAGSALRNAGVGLDGFPVLANLWAVGPAVDERLAENLAPLLPWNSALRAGASCLRAAEDFSGVLLLRILARHIEPVHALLRTVWSVLRPVLHGIEARPLRIWAT